MTQGFCEKRKDDWLVGAKDESDPKHPYFGPTASVSGDGTWLNVVTDDYEGAAMLNIEALPFLIEALQALAASLESKP